MKYLYNYRHWCVFLSLVLLPNLSSAGNVVLTDKLLASLLNKHLPATLFQVANIPWQAGTYGLKMDKLGAATISSSDSIVTIKIPVKTRLSGNVNQDLGITKVALKCQAEFLSEGTLELQPTFSSQGVEFKSTVDFPIPPVQANCDGIQFPVENVLRNMVKNNKLKWE